ncbi:MAG: hypothetical protein ACTSXY_12435 [Promethearchaeota archaeon]
MLKVFWFILWIGTIVFFISYLKIRDRIPTSKRDLFEKCLMGLMIIFLIINVGLLVREHRNIAMEINDCIRFYRYFPFFYNDSEFYFINKWCYEYFDDKDIQKLRGLSWQKIEDINISDLVKGGEIK